jgi:hypothetical protein
MRRNRIHAAFMERMTATNSFQPEPGSLQHTMLGDCGLRVI